jgi:hypothetical protein
MHILRTGPTIDQPWMSALERGKFGTREGSGAERVARRETAARSGRRMAGQTGTSGEVKGARGGAPARRVVTLPDGRCGIVQTHRSGCDCGAAAVSSRPRRAAYTGPARRDRSHTTMRQPWESDTGRSRARRRPEGGLARRRSENGRIVDGRGGTGHGSRSRITNHGSGNGSGCGCGHGSGCGCGSGARGRVSRPSHVPTLAASRHECERQVCSGEVNSPSHERGPRAGRSLDL